MKTELEIKDRLEILEEKQRGPRISIKKAQRILQIQVLRWVLEIEE